MWMLFLSLTLCSSVSLSLWNTCFKNSSWLARLTLCCCHISACNISTQFTLKHTHTQTDTHTPILYPSTFSTSVASFLLYFSNIPATHSALLSWAPKTLGKPLQCYLQHATLNCQLAAHLPSCLLLSPFPFPFFLCLSTLQWEKRTTCLAFLAVTFLSLSVLCPSHFSQCNEGVWNLLSKAYAETRLQLGQEARQVELSRVEFRMLLCASFGKAVTPSPPPPPPFSSFSRRVASRGVFFLLVSLLHMPSLMVAITQKLHEYSSTSSFHPLLPFSHSPFLVVPSSLARPVVPRI